MAEPEAETSNSSEEAIGLLVTELLDAMMRRDAAACADLFTEDGLILSPWGPPARGRDDIESIHQAWFDADEKNKRLILVEADSSGALGYCVLAWSGDYRQSDGSYATERGRSVNVLEKQACGRWKIRVSSLTTD